MTERQRIIKGLELLHKRLLDIATLDKMAMLDATMVADAIALLKEQEPKVLTIDDMGRFKYNDFVIFEHKYPSVVIPAIVVDNIGVDGKLEVLQVVTPSVHGITNAVYSYYGKTWRAWTAHPTDEQRKETQWDG